MDPTAKPGIKLKHVVEDDHRFGAPAEAERLREARDLFVAEVAPQGFDGQRVPAVPARRTGRSPLAAQSTPAPGRRLRASMALDPPASAPPQPA